MDIKELKRNLKALEAVELMSDEVLDRIEDILDNQPTGLVDFRA